MLSGKLYFYITFLIITLSFLESPLTNASPPHQSLLKDANSSNEYPGPIFWHKGARISQISSCTPSSPENKVTCMAIEWVEKGISLSSVKKESFPKGGTNPAAQVCLYADGIPSSLQDAKGRSYPICRFSDHSFVYSWDLVKFLRD